MDEKERLRSVVRWRRKSKVERLERLGDTLSGLMDKRISPRQARFGPVAELWDQLLPEGLGRHCRIADISGGQLKVVVDSAPYAHELRMCGSELLEELQRQCPRARITKIKFVVS